MDGPSFEGQAFVSSRQIERERTDVREARDRILRDAEVKATRRIAQEEQARARGDNKWILPDLDIHLEDDSKSKKKKDKKSKKKKKEKKKKKKKDKGSDNSDSSEESDNDGWVESDKNTAKPTPVPAAKDSQQDAPAERDGWMNIFGTSYSRGDAGHLTKKQKREIERKEAEERSAPGRSSRELNPYFAGGGSGIPTENKAGAPAASKTPHTTKSDGGVSWLMKALKRAEEQAKEENVPLEAIAARRWGSLEKFQEMLAAAKRKQSGHSEEISREKRRDRRSRSRDKRSRSRDGRSRSRDRRSRSRDRKSRSRDRRSRSRDRRSRSRDGKRSHHKAKKDRRRSSSDSSDGGRHHKKSKKRRGSSSSSSDSDDSRSKKDAGGGGILYVKPKSRSDRDRKDSTRGSKETSMSSSTRRPYTSSGWKTDARKASERKEREARDAAEREKQRRLEKGKSDESSSSSSSDEDEEEGAEGGGSQETEAPPQQTEKLLTEAELNSLASKVVKAEIMGNAEQAAELKAKLERARAARQACIAAGGNPDDQDGNASLTEVVTKIKFNDTGKKGKPRKKTKVETHKDGQRIRYFGDDDRLDLKQMYEQERLGTAEDQNAMLSKYAGREKINEDFAVDDAIISKAAAKQSEELAVAKAANRAAAASLELERTLEDCKWCLGSRRSMKHLMVSMGTTVYLSLPGSVSMAEGHCLIVPMSHVGSGTQLDEDVWNEIQEYRKALVKMFRDDGNDCVFMETAMGFKKHPHMVIECIPLPDDLGSMAPMYFQKAIQECESEWSDNKKLVKLKDPRIGRSIPKGLPYFHVDFGLDTGFAHVIEDEAVFSRRFGHEIVGGMLDLEARTFRNPPGESFDKQKAKVIKFADAWRQYDWTKRLQKSSAKPGKADASSSSDSDSDSDRGK